MPGVAAGMALCEPCSTGLGGDCFALVYDPAARRVEALNGSGRAPRELTLEQWLRRPAHMRIFDDLARVTATVQ